VEEAQSIELWGVLRPKNSMAAQVKLSHRVQEGKRDTYTLGRSKSADVVVELSQVSGTHCYVYCDYESARLRVFVEDCSRLGTYVNSSLTRLRKGERLEIHSGDELFLVNPRQENSGEAAFLFVNMRERFFNQMQRIKEQRPPMGLHATVDDADENGGSNATSDAEGDDGRDGGDSKFLCGAPMSISGLAASAGPSMAGVGAAAGAVADMMKGVSQIPMQAQVPVRHIEHDYIIGDQIGAGMCGTVHMCFNRRTAVKSAVKIIDTKKFPMSPGLSVADLREEALMMRELHHPNIIKIVDTYEVNGVIFIVMELVTGGDLLDKIVEVGVYTEEQAREVMVNVLTAVDYLHSKGIVHRDLKPENILLVGGGGGPSSSAGNASSVPRSMTDIKITDFGLAKRADQAGLKTFCGTPQYFAPEVLKRKSTIKGAGRYGMSADMWSLGVVLYILLSGSFPFAEEALFDQITNATYSLAGAEWTGISAEAKHLIRSLLVLRPHERVSAKQALASPWVRGEKLTEDTVPTQQADVPKKSKVRRKSTAKAAKPAGGAATESGAAHQSQVRTVVPTLSNLFWTKRPWSFTGSIDGRRATSSDGVAGSPAPVQALAAVAVPELLAVTTATVADTGSGTTSGGSSTSNPLNGSGSGSTSATATATATASGSGSCSGSGSETVPTSSAKRPRTASKQAPGSEAKQQKARTTSAKKKQANGRGTSKVRVVVRGTGSKSPDRGRGKVDDKKELLDDPIHEYTSDEASVIEEFRPFQGDWDEHLAFASACENSLQAAAAAAAAAAAGGGGGGGGADPFFQDGSLSAVGGMDVKLASVSSGEAAGALKSKPKTATAAKAVKAAKSNGRKDAGLKKDVPSGPTKARQGSMDAWVGRGKAMPVHAVPVATKVSTMTALGGTTTTAAAAAAAAAAATTTTTTTTTITAVSEDGHENDKNKENLKEATVPLVRIREQGGDVPPAVPALALHLCGDGKEASAPAPPTGTGKRGRTSISSGAADAPVGAAGAGAVATGRLRQHRTLMEMFPPSRVAVSVGNADTDTGADINGKDGGEDCGKQSGELLTDQVGFGLAQ
jgi:serine/threonine protein kinase